MAVVRTLRATPGVWVLSGPCAGWAMSATIESGACCKSSRYYHLQSASPVRWHCCHLPVLRCFVSGLSLFLRRSRWLVRFHGLVHDPCIGTADGGASAVRIGGDGRAPWPGLRCASAAAQSRRIQRNGAPATDSDFMMPTPSAVPKRLTRRSATLSRRV